jgi:hypothetical protein
MITVETLLETLKTGSGFWNPLIWGIAIVVAFLLMYILRSFGKTTYKKDTDQVQSFFSGNPEYTKEKMRIQASNLYWGFTESFYWVYAGLRKMHTGNVSDYVLWFIIVLGLFFIVEVIV